MTKGLLLKNRHYTHHPGSECKRLWVLKKGLGRRRLLRSPFLGMSKFIRIAGMGDLIFPKTGA